MEPHGAPWGPMGPYGALWGPLWAHGAAAGMPKAVYACSMTPASTWDVRCQAAGGWAAGGRRERRKSVAPAPQPHPHAHTQDCYPALREDKRKLPSAFPQRQRGPIGGEAKGPQMRPQGAFVDPFGGPRVP